MICRTCGTELPGPMVCPNCNTWQGEVIPEKKRSKVGTIIHNIIQVIGIGLWIFVGLGTILLIISVAMLIRAGM